MPYSHTPVNIPIDAASKSMGADNIAVDGPVNSDVKEIILYQSANALQKNSNITLTHNNLIVDSGASQGYSAPLTIRKSSGRWQITATVGTIDTSNGGPGLGFAYSANYSNATDVATDPSNFFGMRIRGGPEVQCNNNSTSWNPDNSATLLVGQTLTLLVDIPAGKAWGLQNGTVLQNSSQASVGNPAVGTQTNPTFTFTADSHITFFIMATSGATIKLNPETVNSTYSDYSVMTRTVTGIGNMATINTKDMQSGAVPVITNGATTFTRNGSSSDNQQAYATQVAKGKKYFEFELTGNSNSLEVGWAGRGEVTGNEGAGSTGWDVEVYLLNVNAAGGGGPWDMYMQEGTAGSATNTQTSLDSSEITTTPRLKFAIDTDNKKYYLGVVANRHGSYGGWLDTSGNHGQSFDDSAPTGTYSSDEEFTPYVFAHAQTGSGNFYFRPETWLDDPPTDFTAFSSNNLAASPISKSTDQFEAITYDGTGSELEISSLSFEPGFVIIKNLDATDNWMIYDNVRGATKEWHPNSDLNAAETTTAQTLKSFDSDGFTLGTDNEVNTSSEEYLALCWRAGSSGTVTNGMTKTSDSSQTNITRAVNTDNGISIMKYTGNGSASTILHGLGKAPKMIWVKATGKSGVCKMWHTGLSNATRSYVVFATTAAETNFSDDRVWGPDPVAGGTTSIGVGTHTYTNNSTDDYIAYAFAEIDGFSKFGTYTGTGDSSGPFINTGFRPSTIFIKSRSSTTNWSFYCDVQKGNAAGNPTDRGLRPSTNETDANLGSSPFDMYANGFRSLTNAAEHNATGVVYTYAAWARAPFDINNRAR